MNHERRPSLQPDRRAVLIALALAGAVLAAYGPAYGSGFVNFDDDLYVTANPHVQAGLSWAGWVWAWTTTEVSNWHPLTWLSLQLDAQLYGERAWGFHLTSVLLHAANTVLLFWVLARMTGAVWRAAVVAALFGLHPLHVESVAWVAERKDVLSTLFGLLALGAYVRYADWPALGRNFGVVILFALSLLAKPMLVTLPCLLVLLDYWPLGRLRWPATSGLAERWGARRPGVDPASLRWLVVEKLPLFLLVAVSTGATMFAQRQGGAMVTAEQLPAGIRVGNALVSYVRYLANALWPEGLAVFYPHLRFQFPLWQGLAAGVVLAGITVAVLRQARRRPYLLVGWLWYLGTLVPVIGLVQVGNQAMADRYTYVPLIGLFIAVVWEAAELITARRVPRAVPVGLACLVLGACMAATWVQAGYWHDDVTLWEHTLAVTANNDVAHNNLGGALWRLGEKNEAVRHWEEAVRISPFFYFTHHSLGVAYAERGDLDASVRHLAEAVRINPGYPEARSELAHALNRLGARLLQQGKRDEAVAQFRAALRLEPGFGLAHNNLGLALVQQGMLDEAIAEYSEAVRLLPDYAPGHDNLGIALCLRGEPSRALACFHRAVDLNPAHGKYRYDLAHALYRQGQAENGGAEYREGRRLAPDWPQTAGRAAWALATSADPRARNPAAAVRLAEQACEATEYRQPDLVDALAAAYADAGRFDDARAAAGRALGLLGTGQPDRAGAVRERLRLYEQHQPFHQPAPSDVRPSS
jgi:tetratricopeptide (TPR) repeat protein